MAQIIQFSNSESRAEHLPKVPVVAKPEVGTSTAIDFSGARERLAMHRRMDGEQNRPEWSDDIHTLAAYVRLVRAEHDAETARITFEQCRDGITDAWWLGPEDIKERVHENNRNWDIYIGLLRCLAQLPAKTRNEAQAKRSTIGKQWLAPDVSCTNLFGPLREGCLRDDHLFPPSMKLARR